ncbi:hypothetical protein [Empedobacter tilapiae]
MAIKTITVTQLADALREYVKVNKELLTADFAKVTGSSLDKYAKTITAIQGRYQVIHSIMTHVIQGFEPVWKELGELELKSKDLKNFHMKVNYPVVPAEVIGTVIGELYQEGVKDPKMKDITKKVIDMLKSNVKDDAELLSFHGKYDADRLDEFGFAMDGINTLIEAMLADGTGYKIPINKITESNAVEELRSFERQFPKIFKNKIKEIHVSENVGEMFQIDYLNTYGQNPTYKEEDGFKSPLGKRKIVTHPDQADDVIWATIDGNFLKLIDVLTEAEITDIQVQDYLVKIFMEFWNGYGYIFNEAVCIANFKNTDKGLTDKAVEKKLFPHENFTLPAAAPVDEGDEGLGE